MQCPECGGQIYENYEVRHTVSVGGTDSLGWPVAGDDDCITDSNAYSYNCADCWADWADWDDLLRDVNAAARG
jgi:hypothetical protein